MPQNAGAQAAAASPAPVIAHVYALAIAKQQREETLDAVMQACMVQMRLSVGDGQGKIAAGAARCTVCLGHRDPKHTAHYTRVVSAERRSSLPALADQSRSRDLQPRGHKLCRNDWLGFMDATHTLSVLPFVERNRGDFRQAACAARSNAKVPRGVFVDSLFLKE
jgi:hypothetical protein